MMRLFATATLTAALASAGNFYVSPTGSDLSTGSKQTPWATLQHAVDTIQPGDTILVESGTYLGCRIENSGKNHAGSTLKADGNAKVLINAPGPANRHGSIIEVESFGSTVTDWVIAGVEVASAPVYGIDLRGTSRITIRNNRVHGSGRTGIFTGFSDYVLIEGNESFRNGEHGIYVSNSSVYPLVRANSSHHNVGSGIHMNGDLSEGPPGLIQFATVETNVISENGAAGGSGINLDGVDNSMIRLNTLTNNHASGISLYGIDAAHSSSNNQILNNTIVMAPNSRDVINIPDDGAVAPPVGNTVQRNILCTPDLYNSSIVYWDPHVNGFSSDNNVVVNRFSTDSGNTVISLADWQKLGYDNHSVLACDALLNAASPR
jgi:parallel beta-helix repeat protein